MQSFINAVRFIGSMIALMASSAVFAQVLPGDHVVFGPMFSPVYDDSVRVWVLTQDRGTGGALTLEVAAADGNSAPLSGAIYQSDDRVGYSLRTYLYTGLAQDQTYTATLRIDGQVIDRSSQIKNEGARVDDFSFLSGGCGRIYDTSRCIDRPESQTHKNGDPAIFNRMARENSDLMVWLGDATYLLGLQHADGQCPDAIDDWANRDTAFARYMFYRQFHDKLLQAMPQLAITDNHDTGPNEFNKTLPQLEDMKQNFMEWWPNPEYLSTQEGQGLFSSYRYKDVEYFLLDNRSYRDDTLHHLGPEQFEWLKQSLLASTATYKILVNGTPSFAKHWGGRNFSVTQQGDELVQFIQDHNIDGVLSFSSDIHQQEFYGRYGGVSYPLFDVLSGNLNSDVGDGTFTVDYARDSVLSGTKQTYLKVSVYGDVGDRRMKVQYVDLQGHPYFESVIHEDMLKSSEEDTWQLGLAFSGNLLDSSSQQARVRGTVTYVADRHGVPRSAAQPNRNGLTVAGSASRSLADRTFSIGAWIKPAAAPGTGSVIFSNGSTSGGITLGIDTQGRLQYTDHASGSTYALTYAVAIDQWQHMLWKYDNVKRTLSLYQNGLLARSWTNVAPPRASGADMHLGKSFLGGSFNGALDEVNLYGNLLPDEVIQELAEYEPGGTGVLALNGAQNTWIPADVINPALAGDFTIEFWGRLNARPTENAKILASLSRVNNNTTGIAFEFPTSGRLNVVAGTNGSGWNAIQEQGQPWRIGEWNHVAATATRNGTLAFYVNGELLGETSFAGYVPNPTGMGLGDSPYYGSEVRGELEELRIWNRALSQSEIKRNMHLPVPSGSQDLVLYYDFDEVADGAIVSKGNNPLVLTLVGTNVVDGTCPVQRLPHRYRNAVAANWSVRNETDTGLYLSDAVSNMNSNLVIGYRNQLRAERVRPGEKTFRLKGSWLVKPNNMLSGNVSIDLAALLGNPEVIVGNASHFWLVPGRGGHGNQERIEGFADGNVIRFANVPLLDTQTYTLMWTSLRDKDHPIRPRSLQGRPGR